MLVGGVSVNSLCHQGGLFAFSIKLLKFIKNILICVPRMNEGLAGLERYEGE